MIFFIIGRSLAFLVVVTGILIADFDAVYFPQIGLDGFGVSSLLLQAADNRPSRPMNRTSCRQDEGQ